MKWICGLKMMSSGSGPKLKRKEKLTERMPTFSRTSCASRRGSAGKRSSTQSSKKQSLTIWLLMKKMTFYYVIFKDGGLRTGPRLSNVHFRPNKDLRCGKCKIHIQYCYFYFLEVYIDALFAGWWIDRSGAWYLHS